VNAPFVTPHVPQTARARGAIRARFCALNGRSALADLYEGGGLRLRFPRNAQTCEAVLVNTGGGIIGGDRAELSFDVDAGADAMITTQSAEKIYRAQNVPAEVALSLRAGAGARLEWLPQETILFEGAKLKRSFALDMAEDARVTLLEATTFGRIAMGESSISGLLADRWRLRRGGKLIFADDLRLEETIGATLDRKTCGDGARATALFVHLAPEAESMLDLAREKLAPATCAWGASAWNGLLAIRLLSPAPETIRAALIPLLETLRGRPAPRVWQ
jgi:urease accessory protein